MSATRLYATLRRTAAALWGAVRDALTERRARRRHLRQLERIFG